MFIGHFTERPYQDPKTGLFGGAGRPIHDLNLSNAMYDPTVGAALYNRYLDERLYAEEVGFDGLMLNEHHSTPFCMSATINAEAAILARITRRAKIVLLGNIIPIWDDPLWLAETLAMIDMISNGRLVCGWVRGTGRESLAHNTPPTYNWERFVEAHELVIKAWTTPGPFRWEGKHYQFRYINPWCLPLQKPHPPIWLPGVASKESLTWAAKRQIPYVMLATQLEPTRQAFQLYHQIASDEGHHSGPQNLAYLFRVHADDSDDLAEETARKYTQGPVNPFLQEEDSQAPPQELTLPGLAPRSGVLPTGQAARAAFRTPPLMDERMVENYGTIAGTPKSILPQIHHVLEYLRPGSIFFWDGDGAMTHEDQMRSLRLMGAEVIPTVKQMGQELGLLSPFEVG